MLLQFYSSTDFGIAHDGGGGFGGTLWFDEEVSVPKSSQLPALRIQSRSVHL